MSKENRTRTTYSAEEKMEMILAVMSRKTTIQKLSKEKNVAATLVSLWKKQAEEAILERFAGRRPGRRKVEASADEVKDELRLARIAARTAKTRATRLENALKNAKARAAALENGVKTLAAEMGCKMVKAARPRRKKA